MAAQLSKSQRSALHYVATYARGRKMNAQHTIAEILQRSAISQYKYDQAVQMLKSYARVALHFHPDRPDPNMKSVAEALLAQGLYKSQFETRLSNGSVSAFPGGERDLWEQKLFGGAYQREGVTNSERPKYGALNLMLHPDGPAPRFGSCYFLLSPKVSQRCTFTYMDSHQAPPEKGIYDEFDDILAALLTDANRYEFALGEKNLSSLKLIDHLRFNLEKPFPDPSCREPKRNLDYYIEAQIHGDISLMDDVDMLVADPSFLHTSIGRILKELCGKYAIDLYWHRGFSLLAHEVPTDFRGPAMPSLAMRIARNSRVDASVIGDAVMDLRREPSRWIDRGCYKEVLQEFKLLWHVLVKYGKPLS
ncbi:DUF3626 domain-containing protein [Paenibacillus alvei]|uniref:DUF3626 domain-containing protein n=1 Tax=Paenibacillus alvei TaxID=44250 RepID=A0AAP7A0V2_PAEAL|nr:DUF3626 domain-containing protein [Paenibacillus alvei]NOJ73534.1 DUF3626 domain-containing protein [Paenibacillus alvei]